MFNKFWFVRFNLPIDVWNELKGRGIVNNNFDVWITQAIIEKLERDDKNV